MLGDGLHHLTTADLLVQTLGQLLDSSVLLNDVGVVLLGHLPPQSVPLALPLQSFSLGVFLLGFEVLDAVDAAQGFNSCFDFLPFGSFRLRVAALFGERTLELVKLIRVLWLDQTFDL